MNAGNWGAFLSGGVQGANEAQQMEAKNLQNRYYKNALVDPASQENQYWTQARQRDQTQNGQQPWQDQGMLFDPVRNALAKVPTAANNVYQSAKTALSRFLPGQGQHAMGPAAQATVPGASDVAMSRPGPSSSNPASGGIPGATGPMPLPDPPTTTGAPFADGGIPGRGRSGALRQRKAKPGNVAKPSKAAQAAMHPPMEQAPVDNQEMGAAGGPPRNTEAQPGSQDPMLADGGQLNIKKAIKHPGALHEDLGVPQGEKIPKAKLDAAAQRGGKVGARARFAETLSKFSNGGAVDKVSPFKPPIPPKPQPNALEKDVNNDGQRNRLGKTIKKFADGGTPKDQPATGLEPAEPESTGHHLLSEGAKFLGMTALSPDSPYQQVNHALQAGVGAAKDWLSSPWEEQKPKPAGSDGTASGKINRDAPPPGAVNTPPISQREFDNRERSGGFLANGQPAPTSAVVDTQDQAGPPRSAAIPGRGQAPAPASAGPAPEQGPPAPAPIDFSQVQMDHQDIPNTSTQEWDKMKKGVISQLIATRKAGPEQAAMMADDQVSQFQHQNFMQYMQQGIALDRAGNKQGAMAALKTAYNYMPTGHGMHFGLGPDGNIVGVGFDEDTQKPIGTPVKLDQANLNHLMATYSDPKNFQGETVAMMEQKRKNAETEQGQIPYMMAHAGLAGAETGYYGNRNDTTLEAAAIRHAASGQSRLPPQTQKFYASQFKTILDPKDQAEALGVAEMLEGREGKNDPQTQGKIASLVSMMYAMPPEQRQQFAIENKIPLPSLTQQAPDPAMAMYGGYGAGYGIPPR